MSTPQTLHSDDLLAHIMRIKRPLLRVSEVADILTLGTTSVYELIEQGDLEAHDMMGEGSRAAASTAQPGGDLFGFREPERDATSRRYAVRITRRSVITHLLRTTGYSLTAEATVTVLARLMGDLPSSALEAIASRAAAIASARRLQSAA